MDAALDLGQQRARGKNTKPGNTFCELGSVYRRGKGSIYAPGGDDQVFWSEFCVAVHPWSGQRCEDACLHTQRPCGLGCGMADFIKSNKEPDNRQGNKFLPALTVGEPLYGARLQAGEGANSCRESYWRYLGLKLLCPFFGDPEPLRSHSLGSCGSERTEDS